MILFSLFFTFLLIGMVSFGGGYAMLPLFERMVVIEQGWLTRSLFIDMIALSQVTPGPIAINSATFIGFQIASVQGAAVSTLGVVFVPFFLVLIVSKYTQKFKESTVVKGVFIGLKPALVGMIFSSVVSVAGDALIDLKAYIILVFLLFLLWKVKLHPILVIVISGIIGFFVYY